MQQFDLIVIGGGVLGTFHAFHALNRGLKVALIEKNSKPQAATVRNFGQVVPSGMDLKWQTYGRKSLEIYKSLQQKYDIKTANNGSIYIASNDEEITLIEELYVINKANDYESVLLTKEQCFEKYPSLHKDYCKAALFFPQEISADPRYMIHSIHELMKQNENFTLITNTLIKEIDAAGNHCALSDQLGKKYQSAKVILCSGSEFEILYPQYFLESDLELVKLQMLRLKSQPTVFIPGNILTGLTIRRYESFQDCPSYAAINEKEDKNAYWKKWGVHILFKQEADGTVILGDSHEYADVKDKDNIDFFIREEVNQYFFDEGRKIVNLDTWEVETSWAGVYSQCKENDLYQKTIDDKVHIVTGIGGKGMTGSAGFSFEHINKMYG
jgi:FAD dependent oxidoreductase TIGR03364